MKKFSTIFRLVSLGGVVFFSSCSAFFYAPTSQTGHMLEKQGDVAASATYQSTPYTHSLAGDVAYALSNKYFINANYQYLECDVYNRGRFFELGLGYYNRIGQLGFFETSLLYGRVNGFLELEPNEHMNFSMHAPSLSGVIGVKNKYLFATFGVKGGMLGKHHTRYSGPEWHDLWFRGDRGVLALEEMDFAVFAQFSATIGVKYKAVSLSFFNTVLTGPEAYGTNYKFQSEQVAGGLRLQFNFNSGLLQGRR